MIKAKTRAFSMLMAILVLLVWVYPVFGSNASAAEQTAGGTAVQTGDPAFSDLPVSSPIYPFVRYLFSKRIIQGYSDGTFRPKAGLTRAEAVRVFVLLKRLPVSAGSEPHFSDVPQKYWAFDDIEAATRAGLITGYSDGTFKPDKTITRAEAVTLLLKLSSGSLSQDNMAIADVSSENWAYRQAVTAVEAGLAELSSDKLFKPDAPFTRGDMARFISMMFTLSPDLRAAALTGTLYVKKGKVTVAEGYGAPYEVSGEKAIDTGMTITTGEQSEAEINYDDGSGILLQANTEICVTRSDGFNYMNLAGQPKVAVDKLIIKIKKGKIFGVLATRYENGTESEIKPAVDKNSATLWWDYPYSHRERINVEMPWGSIGIRGTYWANEVNPWGQSTAVFTGHAIVSLEGQTTQLYSGQALQISEPSGPPSPPAPMSQQQAQEWMQVSQWIQQRAQEIQGNVPPSPRQLLPPPQSSAEQAPGPPAAQQQADITSIVNNALDRIQEIAATNPGSGTGNSSNPDDNSENNQNPPASPTFSVSGTSVNNGGDTIILNFSQDMDTQTLKQEQIRLGNVMKLYWSDDGTGANRHSIPLANAAAVWTGNRQLTVTLDEPIDGAYIPPEKYPGTALDNTVQSAAGVSVSGSAAYSGHAVLGETDAPSLAAWTLNMETNTMTLTFNEQINTESLDMDKLSIESSGVQGIGVSLSGSTCSRTGFSTTLPITMSEAVFEFIQGQNPSGGTPENICYVKSESGAVRDVAGNSSNPVSDSSALLAGFEPVHPKLGNGTCLINKDGGVSGEIENGDAIMLEFTKIMDTTCAGSSFDVSVTDGSTTSGSSIITISKHGTNKVLCTITAVNQRYSSDGTIYFNNCAGQWYADMLLTITLDGLSGGNAAPVGGGSTEFTLGELAVDSYGYSGSGKTIAVNGSF